jgi:hypothetical protein
MTVSAVFDDVVPLVAKVCSNAAADLRPALGEIRKQQAVEDSSVGSKRAIARPTRNSAIGAKVQPIMG